MDEHALPPAAAAPAHPALIGKYRVIQPLPGGAGGQATAYRAIHPALNKDVVIKLAHRPTAPDTTERDRLLAEGRILAELHHPGLAQIYDLGLHDGRLFLAMEYLPGRTLEQVGRQERPSPRTAAGLVAQVARAAAAHARGVVHGDIKPRKILVDEGGRPRLLNFGLARRSGAWAEDDVVRRRKRRRRRSARGRWTRREVIWPAGRSTRPWISWPGRWARTPPRLPP